MATKTQLAALRERYRHAVRSRRAPVLAALDVEINRAEDFGNDASGLRASRVALREAPGYDGIRTAESVDDLAALWPSALGDFPADAFDGWDAPPETEGAHVVVDLAPKPLTPEEEKADAERAVDSSADLARIVEKRRERAKEEATRPPAPPARQRITGRRKG